MPTRPGSEYSKTDLVADEVVDRMFRKLASLSRATANTIAAVSIITILTAGMIIDIYISRWEAGNAVNSSVSAAILESDKSFCRIINLIVNVRPIPKPGPPESVQERSYNSYQDFLDLKRKFRC